MLCGIFCSCPKERSTFLPTDKRVHAHVAGNAMLHVTPLFYRQNRVLRWARVSGFGSWKEDHQTADMVTSTGWDLQRGLGHCLLYMLP